MGTEKESLVYSVSEAGRLLGISRPTAYRLASEGVLPVVRLGHRLVVPKGRLQALLDGGLPATQQQA